MTEATRPGIAPLPIGLLIRNRRRELGLSQDDLARQLGIPQGSISKLERGLGGNLRVLRILAALSAEARDAHAEPVCHG